MNLLADEWLKKANADRATALRELAVQTDFNANIVCFLAQQCVEKLYKAALASRGTAFPKTHNLQHLDGLLRGCIPSWSCELNDLLILAPGAVEYRYPGQAASRADAQDAFAACERLRTPLLALLE